MQYLKLVAKLCKIINSIMTVPITQEDSTSLFDRELTQQVGLNFELLYGWVCAPRKASILYPKLAHEPNAEALTARLSRSCHGTRC